MGEGVNDCFTVNKKVALPKKTILGFCDGKFKAFVSSNMLYSCLSFRSSRKKLAGLFKKNRTPKQLDMIRANPGFILREI